MQLARLTAVLCLGVAIQKIGLLLLLDKEVFSSDGVTITSMAALYLPIPATNLLFVFWGIRKPAIHIVSSYLTLSALLYFHAWLNLVGMASLIAVGVWFGIAAQSMLGQYNKTWFKTVTSSILISSVAAEMTGAIIATSGVEWIYILSAISFVAALSSFLFFTPLKDGINQGNLANEIRNFPIKKTILIGFIFVTAGFAEATLLGKLHSWGLGSNTYGWFLFGHSIFSIIALCLPSFRFSWVGWNVLWYLSISWIILGPFWITALGFVGLGAAGSVLMRDFRVYYLSTSHNPARMAALVSLTLSSFMAVGALLGGT